MAFPLKLSNPDRQVLRSQLDGTLESLRTYRVSWWAHWARIAEVMLPRRYRWFVTPNQYNRGAQMNQAIIDETSVVAARKCASGLLAGMTSPTHPWFRLGLHNQPDLASGSVKNWLAECSRRMLMVLGQSNFYQTLGTFYHDLTVFNSAAMIIYEDEEQVIRCHSLYLGEFFFASSDRFTVDKLYREFTLTLDQMVQQFELENLPETLQKSYKGGGPQRQTEYIVRHAIEPNTDLYADAQRVIGKVVPPAFKWRELYWVASSSEDAIIKAAGFKSKPFMAGRWQVTGNDAYGSDGPGMIALPATLQLQVEQRRKGEAIDKHVRPPMIASVNMRNEPASILPGALTYVTDVGPNSGFRPAFQIQPQLQDMTLDIKEVQARIESIFFVDLFMMISSLDTVRTATEIDARREEKLIQLGPVIERFENEVLDPIIDRVFDIMLRRGLFPPVPPELQHAEVVPQYISMLAEAQRAAATAAIERMLQVAGNLAGVDPTIMDNIDLDATIERYADYLQVDPELIRPMKDVMQIRAARAKQQQEQQAAQASMAAVQGAQTLSQTDVGGGQNALQKVMEAA